MQIRTLFKGFTALAMSLGLTMCHPVAAEQKPAKLGEVSMATCNVADHYISVIYRMAKLGRSNYEVMAYLDDIANADDREYIGVLMTKVNVTSVQLSVRRAYSEKEVRNRHKEICIEQIGSVINRY